MTPNTPAPVAQLLSCPFCGNDPVVKKLDHGYWDRCITCTVCCCKTGEYSSGNAGHMAAMREAWNRRAVSPAPAAVGDEVQPSVKWIRDYISRVRAIAFEMPAPNTFTPQLMQLCILAERELNEREAAQPAREGAQEAEGETPPELSRKSFQDLRQFAHYIDERVIACEQAIESLRHPAPREAKAEATCETCKGRGNLMQIEGHDAVSFHPCPDCAPPSAESERTAGILPLPDFTVEDDGDICVEWFRNSSNLVSISSNGKRCYAAWMTKGKSGCTTWAATDAMPDDVRAALSALASAPSASGVVEALRIAINRLNRYESDLPNANDDLRTALSTFERGGGK